MTREEAIMVLQKIKPTPRRADGKSTTHTLEMIALDMAIKALEQEPCDDAISRKAAIDAMIKIEQDDIDQYGCKIPEGFDSGPAIEALNNLPSVTSKEVDE